MMHSQVHDVMIYKGPIPDFPEPNPGVCLTCGEIVDRRHTLWGTGELEGKKWEICLSCHIKVQNMCVKIIREYGFVDTVEEMRKTMNSDRELREFFHIDIKEQE